MTAYSDNPYQSPQSMTAYDSPLGMPAKVDWKSIAKRWEILRIPYNVIVGLVGLVVLAIYPILDTVILIGIVAYGLCANVFYTMGPVAEMYLNWFVDVGEGQFVPGWVTRFVRYYYITTLLFTVGCLVSVGLTLVIGVSVACNAAP